MIALVDCNSFYASCEQVFRPDLREKPVVVLSNNDGCIVAANQQAKQLDIPRGQPYFKVAALLRQKGVAVFSSNYELYGDLSNRVMQTLALFSQHIEVYSIDEAFIQFPANSQSLEQLAQQIKQTVWQHCKLPVSVGIGPTKTLAKMANIHAKKHPALNGVCVFKDATDWQPALKQLELHQVWGIGQRLAGRLKEQLKIRTAAELSQQDPLLLRRKFNVLVESLAKELNGEVRHQLNQQLQARKNIISSRSFSRRVYDLQSLAEAVSLYASRACEKMRQQQSAAQLIYVALETGRYDTGRFKNKMLQPLPCATNDTREIIKIAKQLASRLFRPGVAYYKATVGLMELCPVSNIQLPLFTPNPVCEKSEKLMQLVDKINQKQKHQLFFAATGIQRQWDMRRNFRSPRYTSRWCELVRVKC